MTDTPPAPPPLDPSWQDMTPLQLAAQEVQELHEEVQQCKPGSIARRDAMRALRQARRTYHELREAEIQGQFEGADELPEDDWLELLGEAARLMSRRELEVFVGRWKQLLGVDLIDEGTATVRAIKRTA